MMTVQLAADSYLSHCEVHKACEFLGEKNRKIFCSKQYIYKDIVGVRESTGTFKDM